MPSVDSLKYQAPAQPARSAPDELATVKVRYKVPNGDTSRLLSTTLLSEPRPITANLGFSSAVAEVGMLLRGSQHAGRAGFGTAAVRASKFRGSDNEGYRAEFVKLAELASSLRGFETSQR